MREREIERERETRETKRERERERNISRKQIVDCKDTLYKKEGK